MQTERPIDVTATRALGLAIQKELQESGKFDFHPTPFPHFTLKSDKDRCFGIDVQAIHTPPRTGSHFYMIAFMLPQSLIKKHPDLLGEENYQYHYPLQAAITSTMSRYTIMKGVNVRQRQPAPAGYAKKVAMEIRMAAQMFKKNYDEMIKKVEEHIANYKKGQ